LVVLKAALLEVVPVLGLEIAQRLLGWSLSLELAQSHHVVVKLLCLVVLVLHYYHRGAVAHS
jgi:hypothetical protein